MGRVIDITFNDKEYAIEYDRYAVLKFMNQRSNNDDNVLNAINLVHCGLLKHHSNDMPDNDEVLGWLLEMGDGELEKFITELSKCIEEVTTALHETKKSGNLKWGVRK